MMDLHIGVFYNHDMFFSKCILQHHIFFLTIYDLHLIYDFDIRLGIHMLTKLIGHYPCPLFLMLL